MDDISSLANLGIGGIFALLVIRLVLDWLKSRKNGGNDVDFKKVADDVRWLREIHDVRDSDGTPIWYVRRSLEEAIGKLAENIKAQTELFKELVFAVRTLAHDLNRHTGQSEPNLKT